MTRQGAGLFGGFDLEDIKSLRIFQAAVENQKRGTKVVGRDVRSKLGNWARSSVEMIVQRMDHSPLLEEIVMSFLRVPKSDKARMLEAGQDLDLYAVAATWEPKAHAYKAAEDAWKNRQPLRLPDNFAPNHEAILRDFREEMKREKAAKERWLKASEEMLDAASESGSDSDASDSS